MTKGEACEQIRMLSTQWSIPSWAEFKRRVREILDQIDPEPGVFTVREMCELMAKVANARFIGAWSDGSFKIYTAKGSDVAGRGIDELKAKLIELATPPKPPMPTTVTVTLPIEMAKCIATYRDGELAQSCRDALANLEQQP